MQYRAAIFDLDGTLVDSLEDLADSANAMLENYGFPTHEIEKFRYFVGDGSKKLIERILPTEKVADEEFFGEALACYKACYEKRMLNKTRPYEGILEMLEGFEQRRIPMGICTNKHQSAATRIVEHLFPKETFRETIGDCVGMPRKPDPTKVLAIAKHMGVEPEEVAYFGDTSVDMDMAKNAGFLPVGVLWGFRPKEELIEHGAKLLLRHPMEIFENVTFVADYWSEETP